MIQKIHTSVFAVMLVPLIVVLGQSHEKIDPPGTQSRSDPDFVVSLTVSGDEVNGNPIPYVLRFGFKPEATDGYDEENDDWSGDRYAPPPPPPPSFDAALSWQQDRYYIQILNGSADDLLEHVWDIQLQYPEDEIIQVTWNNTGWPNLMTFCQLQDAFGGTFVDINMVTGEGFTNPAFASWDGSTLSLFSSAVNTLKLLVTPMANSYLNQTPFADAGEDQTVSELEQVGVNDTTGVPIFEPTQITLDGSQSDDPDLDILSFEWSSLDGIPLVNEDTQHPTFVAPGVSETVQFRFTLVVSDGDLQSEPDTVNVIVMPNLPVAVAGEDFGVAEGIQAVLDGSGSYSPDGFNLSFTWTVPMGINDYSGVTDDSLIFTAPVVDEPTEYLFSLVVNDGEFDSGPDSILVTVLENGPPVANAGTDQTVIEDIEVTLDGLHSYDPSTTGTFTFLWTSLDGTIILSDPAETNPTFLSPQVEDTTDFMFTLVVNDGAYDSEPDTATVTVLMQNFNTELVGHLEYEQGLNDVWGYAASNGIEYALVGSNTGTSIVDVTTNPSEPEEVAFISGLESTWRDIKTYQNYMYVCTEAQQGIQVVDISSPEEAALVETWTGDNDEGVSVHNIFQADGYLYVVGTNASFGDMHILALSNPAAPILVGTWTGEYLHDVYVRDNYAYGAGIYSSTMYIIDISDKSNPTTVASWTYPGKAHACWLTEDDNYLITADEIAGGHVKIWDIQDFNNINLVSEWTAADAENLTVHNVFVRDNYLYCSYYVFGLQIVDVSDPYQPFLAGYFDSYLGENELFGGNWGIYPFTESCNIYISDRSNGLFVVDFPGCVNSDPFEDALSLSTGWNLLSFDIEIENNVPVDVFGDLIANGNLVYVTGFGESGAVFFDPFGLSFLNTLTAIEPGAGYWVKVNTGTELVQQGYGISNEFTVDLMASWNMLGYWLQESNTPELAFVELIETDNLVYVTGFNESGAALFDPNGLSFLNTLTSLDNSFGYWVKVNEAVDGFQYPEPTTVVNRTPPRETNPDIIKTNVFMYVNGTVAFDHVDYTISDMVDVTTESGLLVGEMEILKDGYLMTGPVYGDDLTTEVIDGAFKDEALVFIYGEYASEPVDISFHGNMELSKVDLTFKSLPETFSLHQN